MALIRTLTVSTIAFERKREELYGFWQTGGFHDACGGARWQKSFNFYWKPPTYSWYPLHVSRYPMMYTWNPPMYSWYPQMYSWYPPMYWNPPIYWKSPHILNTHYTGCLCLMDFVPYLINTWFRTCAIRTDPPSADSLSASDIERGKVWTVMLFAALSPDDLVGAEFI